MLIINDEITHSIKFIINRRPLVRFLYDLHSQYIHILMYLEHFLNIT